MDAVGGWEAETIANQVYTQLGVIDLQDKLVENLSGGERKRLGLASCLVRKPDVILMDEVCRWQGNACVCCCAGVHYQGLFFILTLDLTTAWLKIKIHTHHPLNPSS